MPAPSIRVEKDSMGRMEVPSDVLYGASTQRAVLNFPVSGRPVPEEVIVAFAMLKAAAAHVNVELAKLDAGRAEAIAGACAEIRAGLAGRGGIARHFPVDIYQTGSGTSTNMNANEVIANLVCLARGAEIGSSKDAEYLERGGVHPNDHVNMGQSSNDTFPTAMNVAIAVALQDRLLPAVLRMTEDLERKAAAWDRIVKIGRTHLQDATPIRLGQEFSGYAAQMRHAQRRIGQAIEALAELALGGTAVGTGINTHREFGPRVARRLAAETGVPFREAANHFEAQHSRDCVVEASGLLRTIAVSLSKIASDIRLMGCGPRCGIGELRLPAVQPGSSIMPGKVNPVICESAMMVCCQVIGNDAATAAAGLGGIGGLLDLAVAMPVMAANVLDSVKLLAGACEMFTDNLLAGLEPDEARCKALIEGSLAMCTSLAPVIGYDRAAAIAKEAFAAGKTVRELALEQRILPKEDLDRLLEPFSMTEPEA
ncbi:MAG TPA: class II fumarate hydratase [Phycisphaerales bacterium]|nr:class II fumarate hydratase [Phycisphaerales bacterium]